MIERQAVSARAASAASWLIAARLLSRGLDFVSLLVLARLLQPADFGIVAIAMTLISMVEAIVELPLGQVLVRLPEIARTHLDTAFTLSALRGIALAAGLGALAVPFAAIYGDARLLPLICALSFAPAMRGMLSPRMILFARNIDFRRDFALDCTAKLATFGVAAGVAVTTRSYWAIALGTLAGPAVMMLLSYALAPYRPRLSLAQWPLFRGFLGWTTAAQAVTAVNWQCDRLLLGRFVPPATLGAYSLANDLSYVPEQALIKPVVRPLLGAFALIRDDTERLRLAYMKTAATTLALGMPLMLGLSLLADPAVRLALGGKWIAAIPILRWLPLTLIAPLFTAPLGTLAMTLGQARLTLRLSLQELGIRVPLIAAGAIGYGVPGVIVARMLASALFTIVTMRCVRRLTGTPLRDQLGDIRRVLAAGVAFALVLLAVRPLLDGCTGLVLLAGLIGCAGLATAVYAATLLALWQRAGRPAGAEHALLAIAAVLRAPLARVAARRAQ